MTSETAVPARAPLAVGSTLGRYLVLGESGRGGMGVVIRAYDPRLKREVALKSVNVAKLSAQTYERMLLETQAMAKLSHPSVVVVYDVDIVGEDILIVMEHVTGKTLGEWLEAGDGRRRRPWREILRVFIAAGHGLAAAHAAGLLHRDFKPDNVLVGSDGRARIMDFGIALLRDTASKRTCEVAGTPHYMAPEQHAGDELSPAADQYAFCISLFEALTGQPALGVEEDAFATTKRSSAPQRSQDWNRQIGTKIPVAIAAAIERGLQPDPGARWPSMQALLDALSAVERRRAGPWALAAGTVAMVAGAGMAWVGWHQTERCSGGRAQLERIWNTDRRAEVEQAILATGVGYADNTWLRIAPALDDYAMSWAAQHRETCEATTVRGEQPVEVLDLRMSCLHRAKVQLQAAVALFGRADAQTVEKADDVVLGLPSLARCSDVAALDTEVAPPAEAQAEAVDAVRARLAEAMVLSSAGKYADALRKAKDISITAGRIGYAPLLTEASLVVGRAHAHLGHHADAEAAYARALTTALRSRQKAEAGTAARNLLMQVGPMQGRLQDARAYIPVAKALVEKGSVEEAYLHTALGELHAQQEDFAEAEAEFNEALALLRSWPDQAFAYLHAKGQLTLLLVFTGRTAEAVEEQRTVVEGYERRLGLEHPATLGELSDLGFVLSVMDNRDEAEAVQRQALAGMEKILAPDDPRIGLALNNLGIELNSSGRYREAVEVMHRALSIWKKRTHRLNLSNSHAILGEAFAGQGQWVEAEAEHRNALQLRREVFGDEHFRTAHSRQNLAIALEGLGRYEEAYEELSLAIPLLPTVVSRAQLAVMRGRLGRLLAALGRYDEAEIELAAAQRVLEKEVRDEDPSLVEVKKRRDSVATARRKLRARGSVSSAG